VRLAHAPAARPPRRHPSVRLALLLAATTCAACADDNAGSGEADPGATDTADDTGATDTVDDTEPADDAATPDTAVDTSNPDIGEDTGSTDTDLDSGLPDTVDDTELTDTVDDTELTDADEDSGVTDAAEDSGLTDAADDSAVTDAAEDTGLTDTLDDAPDEDTPSDTDVEPAPFGDCPSFVAGRSRGYISSQNLIEQLLSPVIVEASGLAASRLNPGVLYTHNDSGGRPEVFAIDGANGHRLATLTLSGADANDWEDMAVGPGPEPGASYLYVGDIGDNGGDRVRIEVYRVREPSVARGGAPAATTLTGVERLEFQYPDRGHNAESLAVDPRTGDLYVVTKSGSGEAVVYRASPPFVPLDRMTMTLVTTLRFGVAPLSGRTETTAADFSPGGDLIAIRTYDAIHMWRRPLGRTVDEAFASEPCDAPQVDEPQGETVAFDTLTGGYFTLSEGRGQQLYFFSPR
jgi:hypothetical protein